MIKFLTDTTLLVSDFTPAKTALDEIKQDPMAGWLTVPVDQTELINIKQAAAKINADSDYLICVGIGGSYLGHKAMIDALGNRARTKVVYAGNSLSSAALDQLFTEIGTKDFSINVISKSGTTTEPAIAFRLLKAGLIAKYGEKAAAGRIYVTTDATKGALRAEATKKGYTAFTIPDNIGGRYSVLTAVGLLPMAVAGIDIDKMLEGAREATSGLSAEFNVNMSSATVDTAASTVREASRYAIIRQQLYREQGKEMEILASFDPRLATFAEWWKQLFGESEGKNSQGIFPAAVTYTTDLHSLGQYLQQGRRNIFETVLRIVKPSSRSIVVPEDPQNLDELNYLAGKTLDYINDKAREATVHAHRLGGIPVLEIEIEDLTAKTLGELIYFFELSCAISAKISGVNPFDQPGVEDYKQNMFALLGKPQK
ncbi:glucose-6-phosphate isomerase [Candidatus Saccharibacteria bacterium]|nr:glucose-6-phosphate isomerase [Candidatus Saccharibacteria bacterium]